MSATMASDSDAIRRQAAAGVDMNTPDQHGMTVLMRAAKGDVTLETLTALLHSGADPNARNTTEAAPLNFVLPGNHCDDAAEEGGVLWSNPAAAEQQLAKIRMLVAAGADINNQGSTAPTWDGVGSCFYNPIWTALHAVVSNGWIDGAAVLIELGAQLDVIDRRFRATPLQRSIDRGADRHLHIAHLLAAAGADAGITDAFEDSPFSHLIHRIRNESFQPHCVFCPPEGAEPYDQLFATLARSGANVDLRVPQSGGQTLLAATVREPHLVSELLNAGADVDLADERGRTPLMLASFEGWPTVVSALIGHGADVNARHRDGGTALLGALRSLTVNGVQARDEVVRRLLDAGANPTLGTDWLTPASFVDDYPFLADAIVD